MKLLKLSLILLLLSAVPASAQNNLANGTIDEGTDNVSFTVPIGTVSMNFEVSGTFVGTLQIATSTVEASTPSNVQYVYNGSTGALVNSITAPGSYSITNTGFLRVQIRPVGAAWTSGSASVRVLRGYGPIPAAGSGGGGGGDGDCVGANCDEIVTNTANTAAATASILNELQADEEIPVCNTTSTVFTKNTTAAEQIIAINSTNIPVICAYSVDAEGTTDWKFVRGTGTNCGTGTTDISKNHAFSTTTGYLGETHGNGVGVVIAGASGSAICLVQSAAVVTNFTIRYTYVAP